MQKINLIFGIISLVIGSGLVIASVYEGIKPLGLVLGGLLFINGLVRLWLTRQRKALVGDAGSESKPSPFQQD